MARHVEQRSTVPPATASHRGRPRVVVSALTALNALSAWAGAYGLASGWLSLGATVEQRLPFASPVLGGVALALIVAVPSTVVAVLAARGDDRTDEALVVAGVLLLGWIVVQLAVIRELSFFHPTYLCVGVLMIIAGRRWLVERRRPVASPVQS